MNSNVRIIKDIKVDKTFINFIEKEACDGLDITAVEFFESLSKN